MSDAPCSCPHCRVCAQRRLLAALGGPTSGQQAKHDRVMRAAKRMRVAMDRQLEEVAMKALGMKDG